MKIEDVHVYGLIESIIDSGFPLSDTPEYSEDRAVKLGTSDPGSGHDCYLKGIIVQYRLTADHAFWLQFLRYHFHDVVSSTSKMHSITKMTLKYNRFVLPSSKERIEDLIYTYNNTDIYPIMVDDTQIMSKKDMFEVVIANTPIGVELTARVTDNYLQLKTKLIQRRKHRMSSWQEYCDWVETLPKFMQLTSKVKDEKEDTDND